eukprot:6191584-Pleurochrysis_carterae.AAC.6
MHEDVTKVLFSGWAGLQYWTCARLAEWRVQGTRLAGAEAERGASRQDCASSAMLSVGRDARHGRIGERSTQGGRVRCARDAHTPSVRAHPTRAASRPKPRCCYSVFAQLWYGMVVTPLAISWLLNYIQEPTY